MKNQNSLLIAAAVVSSIFLSTGALAKTAKDCRAEWQADKAGMQSRGVTEKAYIEQCKGGAEPTAAAPPAKPIESTIATQATTSGSKTAKDCKAEWQADKAGMKTRGVTEKAYVEQCRGGSSPVVAAPQAPPPAPAAPPTQTGTSSSQKTAKECVAEWRADKAGMQARGVTQKAYVEQCRAGDADAKRCCSRGQTYGRRTRASSKPTRADRNGSRTGSCASKASAHNDRIADAGSGAAAPGTEKHGDLGSRPVRRRGISKSALPGRYRRMGQLAVENLSLRGNEELRDHQARCLHV